MSHSFGKNHYCALAIILALFDHTASGQTPSDFFPHHLGDLWEYYLLNGVGDDTLQVRVARDSLGSDGFYYIKHDRKLVNPTEPPNFCWYEEFALDTMANVFASGCASFDRLQYKLDANLYDLWIVEDLGAGYNIARLDNVYPDTIFGLPTTVRTISYYSTEDINDTTIWLFQYREDVAGGLGTIYRSGSDLGYVLFLMGAVIDGVQYGDTTIVAATGDTESPLPKGIHIEQNYPNPFNPSTTISFSLPHSGNVSLTIFNLLSEEVATLVAGQMDAGSHTVEWDGTGQPSGVYFYRLRAGDFVETRKLVLVK